MDDRMRIEKHSSRRTAILVTSFLGACSIDQSGIGSQTGTPCFHAARQRITHGHLAKPDVDLYFEFHGQGPPLIALHGDVDHRLFHPVFDRLAEFATVLYYDRRGFGATRLRGKSAQDPRSPSIDIADLEAIADHFHWASVTLLAYSGGGPLGLEFALRRPERVRALVLLSTYGDEGRRVEIAQLRVGDILKDKVREAALAKLELEPPASAVARAIAEFEVLPHVHHRLPIPASTVRGWLEHDCLRPPGEAGAAHRSQWQRIACFGDRLRELQCPTLILCGACDAITPIELSREMAASITGSTLVEMQESGHLAFAEEADRFIEEVRRFIASDPPRPGS